MQSGTYTAHTDCYRVMECELGKSLLIYLRVADFTTLSE